MHRSPSGFDKGFGVKLPAGCLAIIVIQGQVRGVTSVENLCLLSCSHAKVSKLQGVKSGGDCTILLRLEANGSWRADARRNFSCIIAAWSRNRSLVARFWTKLDTAGMERDLGDDSGAKVARGV